MLTAGTLLQERWEIVRLLGTGGMSDVYLARHRSLDTEGAIKVLRADGTPDEIAESRTRFAAEARLQASLQHEAFPRAMDWFETADGHLCLVMDYVPGLTLQERMRHDPPPSAQQILEWARDLVDALQYLHSRTPPIIYRDLKPGNVVVTPEGVIKLIDFGIARRFHTSKSDTQALGTPGYASPEHWKGQTTPRSDIFTLGATLHALLTGRDPEDHVGAPFPEPSTLNPDLPPELDTLVMQLLDVEPTRRPDLATIRTRLEEVRSSAASWTAGFTVVLRRVSNVATEAVAQVVSDTLQVAMGEARGQVLALPRVLQSGLPAPAARRLVQRIESAGGTAAVVRAGPLSQLSASARAALDDVGHALERNPDLSDCRCGACGQTWENRGPHPSRVCPNCSSADWNRFRVFRCRLCRHEFTSSDRSTPPERLFERCPGCGGVLWTPFPIFNAHTALHPDGRMRFSFSAPKAVEAAILWEHGDAIQILPATPGRAGTWTANAPAVRYGDTGFWRARAGRQGEFDISTRYEWSVPALRVWNIEFRPRQFRWLTNHPCVGQAIIGDRTSPWESKPVTQHAVPIESPTPTSWTLLCSDVAGFAYRFNS